MSKKQRDEERLTPKQINKVFDLYHLERLEISFIAERFSVEESFIAELLSRPREIHIPVWCVAWDNEEIAANKKFFKTYRAAKLFHSRLKNITWSKIYEI